MPSLDLSQLKVYPLAERESLTRVDEILVDPTAKPKPINSQLQAMVESAANAIRLALQKQAGILLIYGAHLLRNGAALILDEMMKRGWVSHLATNGAGSIHDWEYAWFGASTESVEMGVAHGKFGTWHETATNTHLALLAGALDGLGYGQSMGRLIIDNGVTLPTTDILEKLIRSEPGHPLTAARAELLTTMHRFGWNGGRIAIDHCWPLASILACAWKHRIPATVHPGIGYDIVANHPIFNGAVLGRAGELDFKLFGGTVDQLDNGVVLSIGSAIMGPQVFEKSLSCVNNLRLQSGREVVKGHSIFVVDLQDGGQWDWSQGEPPKTHPAYYLRFCKSYARMGAKMQYAQCDNLTFLHHLYHRLLAST
jgi:hypothetical protein